MGEGGGPAGVGGVWGGERRKGQDYMKDGPLGGDGGDPKQRDRREAGGGRARLSVPLNQPPAVSTTAACYL
jgi:hypothetical protein